MITVIRVSPFQPNAGEPPFFGQDKLRMVLTCHRSFLAAGDCKRIYLLDSCPEWGKYFKPYGDVHHGAWGKKDSLYQAFDVAKNYKEDTLFLEDDYFWRPNTLSQLTEGLSHFGMVSPYDHPDGYSIYEKNCMELQRFNNITWRWCPTNTHTFAVKYEIFERSMDDFYYGTFDWQMFTKLQISGHKLYTPIYSFATHLVKGKLAYNVDWENLVKQYDKADIPEGISA